ncbi:LysR family transcriptional regulator [Hyphomicrobium sp.]|jgi:DNA-binding transcriptional LysR family regulator|uniref:LysR family transcriptional regulator n=1 Tax=Hyphomicrobium sp. TaxID=82 RepID=UPI002C977FAD|nr:LysR family transcriptional regulator [Hyphomicrobium sp.]HVZ05664.1 LysR family transcriptional regulator [Hyphomicrobium sp.]
MDINAARTFLEIVKTGSFANAAASLHITQTAVSARIRVLEQELGQALFVRHKTGAQLTLPGQKFLRFATSLVCLSEQAIRSIALPQGREIVVALGAELSISSPLVPEWLKWMRQHCPEYALSVRIDSADRLVESIQDGVLDVAILYDAPRRTGLITELLFEEKLVLAQSNSSNNAEFAEHVHIGWGDDVDHALRAAYPAAATYAVAISYGPLALDYILAVGGSGYFRRGFIRPYLEDGRLSLVTNSPEFSYSAYAVYSTAADENVFARVRKGLRAATNSIVL